MSIYFALFLTIFLSQYSCVSHINTVSSELSVYENRFFDVTISQENGTVDCYVSGPPRWPKNIRPNNGNNFCGIAISCRNPEMISIDVSTMKLKKGDTLYLMLTLMNRNGQLSRLPVFLQSGFARYKWSKTEIDIEKTANIWQKLQKEIVLPINLERIGFGIPEEYCELSGMDYDEGYILLDKVQCSRRRTAEFTLD